MSKMLVGVAGFFGVCALICWGESVAIESLGKDGKTGTVELSVPRLYGLVVLCNIVLPMFVMLYLGFSSGQQRSKFVEKGKKDGDEHAEARYSYPKLYAEGFDENAKRFNCYVRGQQHALETLSNFLAMSLVAGLRHPVVTALSGLLWCIARVRWAQGYATGEPNNRYKASGGWGWHIWTVLGMLIVAATSAGLGLLGIV